MMLIQNRFRGLPARRSTTKKRKNMNLGARQIQRSYRGLLGRRKAAEIKRKAGAAEEARLRAEWEKARRLFELAAGVPKERTLIMIKPGAVAAGHAPAILQAIRDNDFEIMMQKEVLMTMEQMAVFYGLYLHRPFMVKLSRLMTEAPMLVLIVEKEEGIDQWRELMGPGDPSVARREAPHTLRALYGDDCYANALHGSEGWHDACRECFFWFGKELLEKYGDMPNPERSPQEMETLLRLCDEAQKSPKISHGATAF